MASTDLTEALLQPGLTSPLPQLDDAQHAALKDFAAIFKKMAQKSVTLKQVIQPNKVIDNLKLHSHSIPLQNLLEIKNQAIVMNLQG